MIINKDIYECPKCRKWYFFDTSKEYTAICEECKCNLTFLDNVDCNTEQAEKVKNAPKYDPTQDPNSKLYIPVIKCPYCSSTDTSKISAMSRVVSTLIFKYSSKKQRNQWYWNKWNNNY